MWTKRYPHSNRLLGPFCIQGERKITDKQLALKTSNVKISITGVNQQYSQSTIRVS